jgi:hypothetical protein
MTPAIEIVDALTKFFIKVEKNDWRLDIQGFKREAHLFLKQTCTVE